MLWLNFLHFYQPANSLNITIKEAVEKSYLRLTKLLEDNPHLQFTANISACLLERLSEDGFKDLIKRWQQLIISGRLEIVGSAAYHAFLPLIPKTEVIYQIKRQEELIKDILKVDIKGGGFFLPEMAYTPDLAKLIKEQGYSWLILDEASLPKNFPNNVNRTYLDVNSGLKVIIRQRHFSNTYLPETIKDLLKLDSAPKLLVTATDAELYGLRHEDPTLELEKIVANNNLKTKNISTFLEEQEELLSIKFRSASWETNWEQDGYNPFILWHDKNNKIHNLLWQLADLAIIVGNKYLNDKNYAWYRWHLNRGLASCFFWWASGYDFSHNFGPKAWNPDIVEGGINDLLRSIRSLADRKSLEDKIRAEKLVAKIRLHLWQKHWRKFWLI